MQETKGLLQKPFMISIVLAVLMLSSRIKTKILIPANKIADQREGIILETIIPQKFGEWHIDQSIIPLQVDAQTQAKLDKIYNQTLARTYAPILYKYLLEAKIITDPSFWLWSHRRWKRKRPADVVLH